MISHWGHYQGLKRDREQLTCICPIIMGVNGHTSERVSRPVLLKQVAQNDNGGRCSAHDDGLLRTATDSLSCRTQHRKASHRTNDASDSENDAAPPVAPSTDEEHSRYGCR